jgi:hypothetical protein
MLGTPSPPPGRGGVPRSAALRPGCLKRHRPPPASTSPPRGSSIDAGSPGALALVNDGHAIRVRAAGVADEGSGRALRPGDRFRAGSITKSFVATVALQLVGKGKLSLSDTVERWLPGILPYGEHVTVRQLLNLTSGVPDNQDPIVAEWLKGNMTRSWSPRELVSLVADKEPDFAPGTSWAYSNNRQGLLDALPHGVRFPRRAAGNLISPPPGHGACSDAHAREHHCRGPRPAIAWRRAHGPRRSWSATRPAPSSTWSVTPVDSPGAPSMTAMDITIHSTTLVRRAEVLRNG